MITCEISNIPQPSHRTFINGVHNRSVFKHSHDTDEALMPLKFAFGGKIEVICEFEGIEYILEGADEEGLVGLREGKAGDIS